MLFRQKLDTFIRTIGPYGYITNQTTQHDRVFDTSGSIFLNEIFRSSQTLEKAAESLCTKFKDITPELIKPDFLDFLHYLEKHNFIVIGESNLELDQKDTTFSYSAENPKTFTFDFRQKDDGGLEVDDSQNLLDEYLGKNPLIFDFQMEVTSRCNERCIHCYIPHENKLNDIDFDFACSIIDQAAAHGVISLTFSGGEATIYPRLSELIRYARQKDLSVHILSNLVYLPEELFQTIVDTHIALVQVSVYSLNPEEHDTITQLPGSLVKTLTHIEKLIAANVPVQISCPVMKINYRSYKNVLSWAFDRKIKAYTDFILMARTDGSTGNLDQRIDKEEARELIKDIVKVDKDYRIMVSEEPETMLFMDQKDKPICGVGINTLCMVAEGDCYPCAGWQGYTVGNLYNQSLEKIWKDSPQLNYLRNIKRRDFPKCQGCADQNYCAMCMVRNFNETGDIFKTPTHFCEMAALNRQVVEEYRETKT